MPGASGFPGYREGWDREFNEALARAGQTDLRYGSRKFSTGIRKKAEGAAKVLNQWKLEYRKML